MKKLLCCCFALSCLMSLATIDRPDVKTFGGTGYYAEGWFDYQVDLHSDGDGLLLSDKTRFVASPHYARPIRKVILSVCATQKDPSRYLRLWPYQGGVEADATAFDCAVRHVGKENAYEFVTFDFDESQDVDAFRLSLDGTGSSGNWRVAMICVVYGNKDADEDARLKEFANELPTPENFRITDFTKTSLSLAADAVEDAVGYRFRIARLEGTPLTELKEDFDSIADSLKMSTGWTLTSENANVSACTETTDKSYVDTKGSSVVRALKIARIESASGEVRVEITSPVSPAAVTGYSFVSKRASNSGTNESSNVVTVYGRPVGSETWQVLNEPFEMSTSMTTTRGSVDETQKIEQVKFVFTAMADITCRPCALDTLRVVYGGNESREIVESGADILSEPVYATNGLETARYECQVQAVGGEHRDSSWTSPLTLDLNWADLTVSAPTGIVTGASGGKLTVSWEPVEGADHYLVDIVSVDDSELFALRNQKASSTTLTVTVPSVGDYAVAVTAVAPGGRARSVSDETTATVVLDELGDVTAEAVDKQVIVATWKTIALAESYQAKLLKLGGDTETVEYGWQAEDGKLVLPEGWSSHDEWEQDVWASGSSHYPRLPYTGCWIASADRGQPVTKLVCRFKCGTTKAAVVDCTRLLVEVQEGTGGWKTLAESAVATKLTELSQTFEVGRDVRRIRLTCRSASAKTMGDVAIGTVSLTYGEETRVEADSQSVTKGEVTFRNLDPTGRYRVVVAPQPSEGATSASTTIDLASEHFRTTGPVPLSTVRHDFWEDRFDSLSTVSSDVEARKTNLDHWQLFKGSGEVEKLLYTAGTNRTTGGVYAFGGNEGAPLLGTLATGSMGSSIGIAFRNDRTVPVHVATLSFDAVQRSVKGKTTSYVLEWLMTTGDGGLDAEGDWQAVVIPETAPCSEAFPEGQTDSRTSVTVTSREGLPDAAIPVGGALVFRWRHEKLAGGPMMAIDNVKVEFRSSQQGMMMIVR